jgi:PilZ domain-containing protein
MSDRRSTNRVRTYVGGRILFGDISALSCLVRDISATGAKLVISGAETLPKRFRLSIPRIGMSTDVQLVWGKGDLCGVRFMTSRPEIRPDAEAQPILPPHRVSPPVRLEVEP